LDRQREDERLKLEQERKVLEEERQAFEQERRLSILAMASPQHAKGGVPATLPADETAQSFQVRAPLHAGGSAFSDHEEKSAVTTLMSAVAGDEDEVYPGDSASAMVFSQAATVVQQEVALQMSERIKALENEMARKQEEVMQQMRFLQQKNESLERTLEEQRLRKEAHRRNGSDGELSLSPRSSPAQATTPHSAKRPQHSRSSHRHSLVDLACSGRRASAGSKTAVRQKRLSIAHEALSAMREDGGERAHCIGDAPRCSRDIYSQRKWWAQQRQFLLEDLHPNGSPGGAFGPAPARGLARRASHAAERQQGVEGLGGASSRVAPGGEVRNLDTMFESAEDARPASPGCSDTAVQLPLRAS